MSHSSNAGGRVSSGNAIAIDASSHDAVSTCDSGQASQGASISNRKLSQTVGLTDEGTKAVCVAVFAKESGTVWGSASLKLHDAMDDCLEAGHVLVAIPSCEHHLAYSIEDTDHACAVVRRLLC